MSCLETQADLKWCRYCLEKEVFRDSNTVIRSISAQAAPAAGLTLGALPPDPRQGGPAPLDPPEAAPAAPAAQD